MKLIFTRKMLVGCIISSMVLAGCKEVETTPTSDTGIQVIQMEKDTEKSVFTDEVNVDQGIVDILPIDVVILNKCGVTIGMLSVIDPTTKEQINLSQIEDGKALTVSMNWPRNETKLKWALYNTNGELCVESESNIEGVTKSVLIDISGDGDADNINVTVE